MSTTPEELPAQDWAIEHAAAHAAQRRMTAALSPQERLIAMDRLCADLTALRAAGRLARAQRPV